MRLVIDLQGAQSTSLAHGTGGHSVALAQAMTKLKGKHEIIIALNGSFTETIEPIRAAFDDLISQDNIRVWSMPVPATAAGKGDRWRRKAAEILREEFLASLRPDIVHITGMFEGFESNAVHSIGVAQSGVFRNAVTVYEPPPSLFDNPKPTTADPYEPFFQSQLAHLKRADFFFGVTASVETAIVERLGIASDRSASIGIAVGPQFVPGDISIPFVERLKKKMGVTRSMVLCADASGEKNNFLRLVKAFSLLPPILRKSHQLVVVAKNSEELKNEFEKSLLLFGLPPDCVVITGAISADALVQLYRSCALFIAPAAVEDSGFATLEAMSCGAPVIGANTPSSAALLDNVKAYFDPLSPMSISKKIAEVLYSEQYRDALVSSGIVQAKKFTWDHSGSKALASFEKWQESLGTPKPTNTKVAVLVSNKSDNKNDEELDKSIIKKITAIRNAIAKESDWLSTSHAIAANHPEQEKPRLLVDLSELVYRDSKTGIQRVVRSILMVLLTEPPAGFDVRCVYLCTKDFVYKYADEFVCKFLGRPSIGVADAPANWSYQDVFFGLDYQRESVLTNQAAYDEMRRLGVKIYFVVHDLLPILLPKAFKKGSYDEHERWLSVLARYDGIVAVSRTVADEIIEWLTFTGPARLRPIKVGWFHHGADVSGSVPTKGLPADAAETLAAIASRQTFLTVGTIEPRKGQLQTLAAFELLWEQGVDVNLVIVGKHGWSVDLLVGSLLTHPELGKRLFWLKGISDEYLEKVYASSVCLISPSEGEGFGLPLIEAARHGLPIIARDIPVFREVAGENAQYFANKLDPATISEAIQQWIEINKASSANVRKHCAIEWQTWKQSAAQLMDVVLGGNWYKTSSPAGVQRFWAGAGRLQTKVGKRVGHEMVTTGQKGCLLFGPYIRVARGFYKISLIGTVGAGGAAGALLDAACDKGEVVLGESKVMDLDGEGTIVSLEVIIEDETPDFEVRLEVDELSTISVSMLVLERIGNLSVE
jgi:glycosyltransferase involved in cell wall biosynthesis